MKITKKGTWLNESKKNYEWKERCHKQETKNFAVGLNPIEKGQFTLPNKALVSTLRVLIIYNWEVKQKNRVTFYLQIFKQWKIPADLYKQSHWMQYFKII